MYARGAAVFGRLIAVISTISSLVSAFGVSSLPATEMEYLGSTSWSGTAVDKSNLSNRLEDGSPHNQLGGAGSGIAWTGRGDEYVLVSDRGPGDGAVSYRCRVHRVEILVTSDRPAKVRASLLSTVLLTGREHQPLIGLAAAFAPRSNLEPQRFDPEGIRLTRAGAMLISEEYGPSVNEFAANGAWIRSITVPRKLNIDHPAARAEDELPPHNTHGRQPNRGLEGIALSGDGQTLYAMMQGPLLQDGALDAQGERAGTNVRLLALDWHGSKPAQEFVYQLNGPTYGVNEIEWLAPGRLLILERDGKAGQKARFKRIFAANLDAATDVAAVDSLPVNGLPDGIQPVGKRPYLDLLDAHWPLAGDAFPEKTEGLALGPTLPDGRRLLVITSDNDFQSDVPTRFDVFAVPNAAP